ncbi:MAG: DMT family transporter [Candidatus Moduliflexus flocculans]|nr:DMT family transporter [Candidatus Moduliflexus flocculans]
MLTGSGGRAAVESGPARRPGLPFLGIRQPFHGPHRRDHPGGEHVLERPAGGIGQPRHRLGLRPVCRLLGTTAAALLVGGFCYGISIVLYISAAQKLGATRSQMFFSTAPFFGLGSSVLILGEKIRPVQTMAAILIVVSLAILFIGRHAHSHVHRAKKHEHWHQHNDGHHAHGHPGDIKDLGHVHEHEHGESAHTHPHLPDIHHRHGRED